MGITKNKAWSIVIAIIALILLNLVAFIIPVNHGITFWLGYSFAIFANLTIVATSIVTLNKQNLNDTFLGLSPLSVSWIYFLIQTTLSIFQMLKFDFSYLGAIIGNSILAGFTIIILILSNMAINKIKEIDEEINEKVFYIKNLKTEIELLETENNDILEKIKDLKETIRFSDSMSHSQLVSLENKIMNKFNALKENIDNSSMALILCDEIQKLLYERNKKCILLKGTPEPKKDIDNTGVNILAVTFSILSIAVISALIITFVIVPSKKYNNAVALYEAERYDEAIIAFEDLGTYKDSKNKVEIIKKDLLEEKYQQAESYYSTQNYIDAIQIYYELGDYKNSKDRIEQIYNKFAQGDEIYFGVYEGNPIEWKILKTEKSRMLLLTEQPVEILAFNDELKNITYENSSIREWLNNEFVSEFSDEQLSRILKNDDEINDGIFLLTEEQYNEYSKNISLNTNQDWWLRTKTDAGMMYVHGENSEVNTYGESVVRNMGVRPCVWISLY